MRKFFKYFKRLLFVFSALFCAALFIAVAAGHWPRAIPRVDAIIVLGAAIKTPAAYYRSLEGLKLYQQGKAPVLVLSGGVDYPKSISEAEYMRRVILSAAEGGAPNMILEDGSRSTYENIRNSKAKVPNAQTVIIVSDRYHLARAALLAYRLGFKKVYWSSPEKDFYPRRELYFYYLREAAALIFYLPKFIGG